MSLNAISVNDGPNSLVKFGELLLQRTIIGTATVVFEAVWQTQDLLSEQSNRLRKIVDENSPELMAVQQLSVLHDAACFIALHGGGLGMLTCGRGGRSCAGFVVADGTLLHCRIENFVTLLQLTFHIIESTLKHAPDATSLGEYGL